MSAALSVLAVAWVLARYLGSALILLGVLTHPWRHWLDRLWWWVAAAGNSFAWAAHESLGGHIFWAAFYFSVFTGTTIVSYQMVDARRERVSSDG